MRLVRFRKPRAEPSGCPRRPLSAPVGPAAGAGSVEVGQDVGRSLVQGPSKATEVGQGGGDAIS